MQDSRVHIVYKLLKLGATPTTLVYPIPLIPIFAWLLASASVLDLFVVVAFVSLFYNAINLWNHLNDLEEDLAAGKSGSQVLVQVRDKVKTLVIILYLVCFFIVLIQSKTQSAALLYVVVAAVTWLYSDKIYFKRISGFRLKEKYQWELLTYIVVPPAFFALIWALISVFSYRAMAFVSVSSIYYLSGALLKDLKDISSDMEAGYATLAVVFDPQILFKTSLLLNFLNHALIVFFSMAYLPIGCIFGSLTFFVLLKVLLDMRRYGWRLGSEVYNTLKLYPLVYPTSYLLMVLGVVFTQALDLQGFW